MEKRYCLVCKDVPNLDITYSYIYEALESAGFIYDEENPGLVISLGGDGTFLKAVDLYREKRPIFLGINLGKLGFLCQFSENEIDYALELLLNNEERKYIKYPLIMVQCGDRKYFALNEVRITAMNGTSTSFDVLIDDVNLERLNADGMSICSPLGSSGINKGLGGAIVDPSIFALELTEITPINNKFYCSINSPLIINGKSCITLENFSSIKINLFMDNRAYQIEDMKKMLISYCDEYVLVLKNLNNNYINKLNNSFIK